MRRTPEMGAELRVADDKGRVLLGKRYAGQRFAMREAEDGSAVLTPVVMVPAQGVRSAPRGLPWTEPHLGANERGQVVLEWWQGGRTLTLFVRSEDQVEYLKAWGSHI